METTVSALLQRKGTFFKARMFADPLLLNLVTRVRKRLDGWRLTEGKHRWRETAGQHLGHRGNRRNRHQLRGIAQARI